MGTSVLEAKTWSEGEDTREKMTGSIQLLEDPGFIPISSVSSLIATVAVKQLRQIQKNDKLDS